MKHNYLLLSSIAIAVAGVFLTSNASGPASNGNRATGAPGDGPALCTSCHAGGAFGTVSIDLELLDGGGAAVSEYTPGATYTVNVDVSNSTGSPAGYGFQTIAIEDAGDTPTNSFSNAGTGVQLSTSSSRQYAEHVSGPSSTGSFTFDWTAPAEGTGSVTFYAAANAVNGNGANSGDNAGLSDFTFNEMVADTNDTTGNGEWPEGIFDVRQPAQLVLYPNPAQEVVTMDGLESGRKEVLVFNAHGQVVLRTTTDERVLNVSQLETGVYFVRVDERLGRFMKL